MDIRPAARPSVSNILMVNENTEYGIKLHINCRRVTLRAREPVSIKIAFELGKSGTDYLHLASGETWTEEEIYGDISIYFQCEVPNTTVEIFQMIQR